MSCTLTKCKCKSFTKDGYCAKHRYWSDDKEYICEHAKKYLDKISKSKTQKNKIKHISRLFNYLQYKETFFEQNNKFKETVFEKINELEHTPYNDPELKKEAFEAFKKVLKFYK